MNPVEAFMKALNAGMDAVHHALERQAPIVDDVPECEVCEGEGKLWSEGIKYTCPNCNGNGTSWSNN